MLWCYLCVIKYWTRKKDPAICPRQNVTQTFSFNCFLTFGLAVATPSVPPNPPLFLSRYLHHHSNEHPNSKITSSLKKKKKLSVPFPPLIWFFLPRIDNRQLLFMRSETDGCAAMSFCLFGRARKSCSRTEEAKGKSRYFDLNFLPFFCPKIFVPSCHYSNYIISSYIHTTFW